MCFENRCVGAWCMERSSSSRVGFNIPPNTYRIGHIGDDFCGSDDPTNSVKH